MIIIGYSTFYVYGYILTPIKAKREGITRQEAIEKILALREKGTL
jgi:hypothetical protein